MAQSNNISDVKYLLYLAKSIKADIDEYVKPPEEGTSPRTNQVVPFSIIRGTRGYIEKNVHQINGAYENGWYDACAVMIRRLIETLIIEVYESHNLTANIKGSDGNYFYLNDLINMILQETTWNLSRNTKQGLPKLKNIGDVSAHSRRFIAHRSDIEKVIYDLRIVTQELVYLAKLK